MSGDPRTTDLMVDALLAAHEVPALGEDFASRVLAAAQSLPAGPGVNSPWPRRSLRPWRRSPLWFGFIALNIVAASAVAAMVSGIPVWHHLTEIVQNVKHSLHQEPVHSARHRVAPPRRVASLAPASSPAAIASTVIEPHPKSAIPIEAREAIAPLRQPGARPLAIGGPNNHHARMAQARRREKLILHRPNTPLEMLPHRARANGFPITARRHAVEDIPRAAPDRTLRTPQPPVNALPREPRPVVRQPAEPYGPRLEPQRAFPERQDRADEHLEVWREARAERRRMHAFDHRPGRGRPRPRRGRSN